MKVNSNHLSVIQKLAKAELHMHLEGSLEPAMMFALAKRNQVKLPYQSVLEIEKAYQFANLQGFLNLYYRGMSVLLCEQDYEELTRAYLDRAYQDRVTHVELFVDPQAHVNRGVSLATLFGGIRRAIMHAEKVQGMTVSIIVCFLRDLGQEAALAAFDQLMPYRDRFIGIGLDSAELGHPPRLFKELFDRARAEKLKLVAHAGEEGPASYVWEALDVLGVNRIDHGNAIATDPALIQRVARDGIALTMCPLSNQSLKVVPDLRLHPALRLLEQGVNVTINSDDPAYFGGYINQNYLALAEALQLSSADLAQLAENSLRCKFV